jgi:NitT/TauT family transport system ATP-binding protein
MLNTTKAVSAELLKTPRRVEGEILSIKDVSRGFDKTQEELLVLDGVNLTLHEGETACWVAQGRASRRCCALSRG